MTADMQGTRFQEMSPQSTTEIDLCVTTLHQLQGTTPSAHAMIQ